MTSVNPRTITRYLLSFVFFLRKYKVIAIKTQIEHVILDDMAYRIASTIEPPLKFKAIVNCLSIASNISKIGSVPKSVSGKNPLKFVNFKCHCKFNVLFLIVL